MKIEIIRILDLQLLQKCLTIFISKQSQLSIMTWVKDLMKTIRNVSGNKIKNTISHILVVHPFRDDNPALITSSTKRRLLATIILDAIYCFLTE